MAHGMDKTENTRTGLCAGFLRVANLFGLRVPDSLPGHDILDPDYDGYVIFSNYAWLTDDGYWHDGVIVSEDGCTEETIKYMTEYTYRRIKINDLILSSDYYGRK